MNTTHPTDAKDEIARVAFEIWEAEGQPEGRDHEHWQRAKALVEQGRAREAGTGDAGETAARKDEASQDSAQTPSEKPGPRNPSPYPDTNSEGFVTVSGEDAAAIPPKARRKAAGRKTVETN